MKKLLYFLTLISVFLISCSENEETEQDHNSTTSDNEVEMTTEDLVFKTVESLPEYKDAAEHIQAMTNGEQSISIVMEVPNEDRKEYYLKVGYNQETWFEPYYHFYVDPETFDVSIEDMVLGDVVSIETWRERQESQ